MLFRRPDTPNPKRTMGNNGPAVRRDPDLVGRALPSQTGIALNAFGAPINPVMAAQSRRKDAGTPVSNFTRQDQMRKLTVGRDISLNGEITTCDHLVVEGNVNATIKGGKMLEITETGFFNGLADVENADIAGRFDGDIMVRNKLTIRPTATITGNIHYVRLQVDTGAAISGQLHAMAEEKTTSVTQNDIQQPVFEQNNTAMDAVLLPDTNYAFRQFGATL
jgi:cytoskeletal protein CcmA (bactofilin family)